MDSKQSVSSNGPTYFCDKGDSHHDEDSARGRKVFCLGGNYSCDKGDYPSAPVSIALKSSPLENKSQTS